MLVVLQATPGGRLVEVVVGAGFATRDGLADGSPVDNGRLPCYVYQNAGFKVAAGTPVAFPTKYSC